MRISALLLVPFLLASCIPMPRAVDVESSSQLGSQSRENALLDYSSVTKTMGIKDKEVVLISDDTTILMLDVPDNITKGRTDKKSATLKVQRKNQDDPLLVPFEVSIFIDFVDITSLSGGKYGLNFWSLGQSEYFIYDPAKPSVYKLYFDLENSSDGGFCDWENEIVISTDYGSGKDVAEGTLVRLYLFANRVREKVLVFESSGKGIWYRVRQGNVLEYKSATFQDAGAVETFDYSRFVSK